MGPRRPLDQFLELPEAEPALEFWHGEVTQKVSPKGPHGAIQYGFARQIDDIRTLRRLVRMFTETRITFDGISTVPDLIIYRRDRIPREADGQIAQDFTVPPDVAVEIFSPGQSRPKTIERCRWYVENGVRLAVFADPSRRTVQLFRPGAETSDLRTTDVLDLGDVLPEFALTVDELFAPLVADWE